MGQDRHLPKAMKSIFDASEEGRVQVLVPSMVLIETVFLMQRQRVKQAVLDQLLLLDELPEFGLHNLETLRQPLEDRTVTISRAQSSLSFPANFMLVGAMNPYPCGWYGDNQYECTCSLAVASRYQKRLSGPLLDRSAKPPGVDRHAWRRGGAAGGLRQAQR
jgi:hypothetical protein